MKRYESVAGLSLLLGAGSVGCEIDIPEPGGQLSSGSYPQGSGSGGGGDTDGDSPDESTSGGDDGLGSTGGVTGWTSDPGNPTGSPPGGDTGEWSTGSGGTGGAMGTGGAVGTGGESGGSGSSGGYTSSGYGYGYYDYFDLDTADGHPCITGQDCRRLSR